ncbi:photosystem I assembly protein Ycf3 [Maioricimonas rarisocia]|uniref:Photosystem I assembly protein Ycf3 n=1 Tax=Maioricimonas rarisocia TaxID=2528026 RepID=A0A517ZCJ3_9PLAN|nr:tetratricopeptide repeat protein [Maioricimonas rarisocia]QDU40214.1 photosystem I assembly protein Ycf3 [Maioricimonas rarisocia]
MPPENDLQHDTMPGRRPQSWGRSLLTVSIAVVSLIAGGIAGGLVLQRQRSMQDGESAESADSSDQTANDPLGLSRTASSQAAAAPEESPVDGMQAGTSSPLQPGTPNDEISADERLAELIENAGPEGFDAQAVANMLQRADEHLVETSYAVALRMYQELLPRTSGAVNIHVRFRLALCAEVLDDTSTALEQYQTVVSANADPVLTRLARLGQVRIWESNDRLDVAIAALYREIVTQSDAAPSSAGIDEALHQLGHCLSRRAATGITADPLDPAHLITPRPVVMPAELLALTRQSNAGKVPQRPEELTVTQRLAPFAESVFLKVRYHQRSVADVFRAMVTASGWAPEVTPDAVARMVGRSISIDAPELSLAFLLDSTLEPFGLAWKLTGNRIVVFEPQDVTSPEELQRRRIVAARALQYAVTNAPDHSWSSVSYMMLGELAASSGHAADALRIFRQATRLFPRSTSITEAWFNLGKVQLQLGDHEGALETFYQAVDNVETHPMERIAYLHIGRILLERDEARKAVMPLRRALALNEGTDQEAVAAMMLSSAYLMLGNPRGANSVLMSRRDLLRDRDVRDQAAFLASLIRYRAAGDPLIRQREAVTLITALTHADPAAMFGGHWWILVGEAFRDVGMAVEEVSLYEHCVRTTYRFPLRDQILLILAERRLQQGNSIDTKQLLEALSTDSLLDASHVAEIMLAEVAFSAGDPQLTIDRCGMLLDRDNLPEAVRPQVLRLMGRAYQAQGDHQSAIYCFSGLVPGTLKRGGPLPSAQQLEVVR